METKTRILGRQSTGDNNIVINTTLETTPLGIAANVGLIAGFACLAGASMAHAVGNRMAAANFGKWAITCGMVSIVTGIIGIAENVSSPTLYTKVTTLE